jgi:hypothetical protein
MTSTPDHSMNQSRSRHRERNAMRRFWGELAAWANDEPGVPMRTCSDVDDAVALVAQPFAEHVWAVANGPRASAKDVERARKIAHARACAAIREAGFCTPKGRR